MTGVQFVRYTLSCPHSTYDQAVGELVDLPARGWQEYSEGTLVFWLQAGQEEESATAATLHRLAALGTLAAARDDEAWLQSWRRFHSAVRVGAVTVRPPWLSPQPGALDVMVDIGMAFGTGSHHTTRQCLAALQEVPLGSLLDLGTGSAVLALAALRLGFSPVYACDNDEVALLAAGENARLNGLWPRFFSADVTDRAVPLPATDVLVANIAVRAIVVLGERISSGDVSAPRQAILAGLLETQAEQARAAFAGYRLADRQHAGEWVMLRLERE